MVDLAVAYASCLRTSGAHYENFPVASLLLPRDARRHVAALYAFARAADDFADEGDRSIDERLRLLDRWQCRLRDSAPGSSAATLPLHPGEPPNAVEIFVALRATIERCDLPVGLFEDLLSAFRQDVTVTRYAQWADVLDYCRRSANPVGRLVLRILGQASAEFDGWSDDICTALQLTNFWQDLASDYARGRIYIPIEEWHGADERGLGGSHLTPSWAHALAAAVARTRALFAAGRPLCDRTRGRLRYELRATWLGGMRILDRIERAKFDVLGARPTIGASDVPALAAALLTWPFARARGGVST